MKTALLLWAALTFQSLADLPITTLKPDAEELQQSFNQSSDRLRLVCVWSPT